MFAIASFTTNSQAPDLKKSRSASGGDSNTPSGLFKLPSFFEMKGAPKANTGRKSTHNSKLVVIIVPAIVT